MLGGLLGGVALFSLYALLLWVLRRARARMPRADATASGKREDTPGGQQAGAYVTPHGREAGVVGEGEPQLARLPEVHRRGPPRWSSGSAASSADGGNGQRSDVAGGEANGSVDPWHSAPLHNGWWQDEEAGEEWGGAPAPPPSLPPPAAAIRGVGPIKDRPHQREALHKRPHSSSDSSSESAAGPRTYVRGMHVEAVVGDGLSALGGMGSATARPPVPPPR